MEGTEVVELRQLPQPARLQVLMALVLFHTVLEPVLRVPQV